MINWPTSVAIFFTIFCDIQVIIVRRKFVVSTEGQDEFKASLRAYINATGLAQGCIEYDSI